MKGKSTKKGAESEEGKVRQKKDTEQNQELHPSEIMEAARNPDQASPEAILTMQKTQGNRFVQRALANNAIQRSPKTAKKPVGAIVMTDEDFTEDHYKQTLYVGFPPKSAKSES